jgi:hypothetical protein
MVDSYHEVIEQMFECKLWENWQLQVFLLDKEQCQDKEKWLAHYLKELTTEDRQTHFLGSLPELVYDLNI